ncbi:MAG: hypothetical protein AB8B51_02495 [Sedimentitalea sp.]
MIDPDARAIARMTKPGVGYNVLIAVQQVSDQGTGLWPSHAGVEGS